MSRFLPFYQWLVTQEGDYWTIKNLAVGHFLSVNGPVIENGSVTVSDKAALWELRLDKTYATRSQQDGPIYDTIAQASGPRYNIFYAGTQFSLAVGASQAVTLSGASQAHLRWRVEMSEYFLLLMRHQVILLLNLLVCSSLT